MEHYRTGPGQSLGGSFYHELGESNERAERDHTRCRVGG